MIHTFHIRFFDSSMLCSGAMSGTHIKIKVKANLPPQCGEPFSTSIITFKIKIHYCSIHKARNGSTLGEGGEGVCKWVVGGLWDLK